MMNVVRMMASLLWTTAPLGVFAFLADGPPDSWRFVFCFAIWGWLSAWTWKPIQYDMFVDQDGKRAPYRVFSEPVRPVEPDVGPQA